MNYKVSLFVLVVVLLFSACHEEQLQHALPNEFSNVEFYEEDIAESTEASVPITEQLKTPPPPPPSPEQSSIETEPSQAKKIIKDGSLQIKVENLKSVKKTVDSLIKFHDAYYANESFHTNKWKSSFELKIRIPSKNFEKFITALENGNGELQKRELDARDVTEQFIDLEVRLSNKKAYLQRYNELLNRANTVKEILEIQEKSRWIEEEIEIATGRLNYLRNQVAFSTIDLLLFEEKEPENLENKPGFFKKLSASLMDGWSILLGILLFTVQLWPVWLLVLLVWIAWKRFKK